MATNDGVNKNHPIGDLENWNTDRTVEPITMVRGMMGKDSNGAYQYLQVNTSGQVVIDPTALDARYLPLAGGTMTGVLQLTTGSASAPGLALGASNTGVYAGSGTVAIATNGNQSAVFFSGSFRPSGNIASPTYGNPYLTFINGNTSANSNTNYFQITNAATGGNPSFGAYGSDTNINMVLSPKGTGSVLIGSAGSTTVPGLTFSAYPTAGFSAYNASSIHIVLNSGLSYTISTTGIVLRTTTASNILDGSLNKLLNFVTTGSAVNYLTITNAATGNNPILGVAGSNADIGITLTPKGNGNVTVSANSLIAPYFQTSTAPTTNSTGTVAIVAKDTGVATNNAGWLPMKDSSGNTIYIPYWT